MTLSAFSNKVRKIIRDDIKENHYDTGELWRSIKITCKEKKNGMNIKIIGLEYIIYLDEGSYTDYLFNKPEITNLVAKYYAEKIKSEIKNILKK